MPSGPRSPCVFASGSRYLQAGIPPPCPALAGPASPLRDGGPACTGGCSRVAALSSVQRQGGREMVRGRVGAFPAQGHTVHGAV